MEAGVDFAVKAIVFARIGGEDVVALVSSIKGRPRGRPDKLTLPGGRANPGETEEAVAHRECAEELGGEIISCLGPFDTRNEEDRQTHIRVFMMSAVISELPTELQQTLTLFDPCVPEETEGWMWMLLSALDEHENQIIGDHLEEIREAECWLPDYRRAHVNR